MNLFQGYCRSATAVASDLILVELDGGQHSLFYNPLPFDLNFNQGLVGILWPICPTVLGMLIPGSGEDFIDRATQRVITGWRLFNRNQKPLDRLSYQSAVVQEMVPSCFFFPYLEFHYYNHWCFRIYIWSIISSHLIIINFIWGLVTHLVMQETIILKNRHDTNNIASNINKVVSKYLS